MAFGFVSEPIPETIDSDGRISPGVYRQPRALTASASKIDLKNAKEKEKLKKRIESTATKWQSEAWDYYDYIGQIKFTANLIANVISRINLYTAYVDDSRRVPTPVDQSDGAIEHAGTINNVLHALESSDGGSSDLLRTAALSLFIAGEFYLVRIPGNALERTPDRWVVKSVNEVVVKSLRGKEIGTFLKSTRNEPEEDMERLPDDGFISRMWRRHPRYSGEADSSLLGILEDCDDLLGFAREGRQASRSRANAGLLYIPSELESSQAPEADGDEDEERRAAQESLVDQISEALVGPATSDDHANSVVPLIFRGPAQYANDIKYIQLNRSTDPHFQQQIDSKMDSILSSLDIPKDIAKGLSSVKYSNGIVIEESLYKSHVEPLILLITDLLTNGFLRPALRAQDVPEDVISRTVIWYDPSAIAAKPSKAEAANFGVTNDIVSASAWRTANGFSEADAPNQEEQALKLLKAKLTLDPQIATTMMNHMFPEILATSREANLATSAPSDAEALNQALGNPLSGEAPQQQQQFPEGIVQDGEAEGPNPTTSQSDIPLIEP